MTANAKYHVVLEDSASGETLGLLLTEGTFVGRTARLSNPYAAKVGGGDRALSDLTDFSVYGQTEWRGGRGQDRFEDEERYYDARELETRIKGQVTLGPLSHVTGVTANVPFYDPTEYAGQPIHQLSSSKQERSMSFTAPSGSLGCTGVWLLLRKAGPLVSAYTISLCEDDSGSPGTVVKTATVGDSDLTTQFVEVQLAWTSKTLDDGDSYYIKLTPPDNPLSETNYIEWAADTTPGYASGAADYKPRVWTVGGSDVGGTDQIETASWTAETGHDFWFRINDGDVMAGQIVVNPVRFNGKWYCAAGNAVYLWNTSTEVWDSLETPTGDVTAMLTWGDYLWVARGANNVRIMDTSSDWDDADGPVEAELLAEHNGYLYKSDPTTIEELTYTADGTTWSSAITVGPGDWQIRGIAGFREELAIANDVGLWLMSVAWAYQVLDWKTLENAVNGAALMTWAKTNELFISVGHGLYRWTGSTMVSCGPDQDTGLPAARAGIIAALCGTVNWLYAAVDAGASARSSVMAYGGSGWHEVVRAQVDGDRIRALGYETLSSPPRLWYGEGDVMRYVEMPDYSDNPYAYSGVAFIGDGQMELSTWGSELMPVVKDWRYVVVHSENCATLREIELFYEVDRSGLWLSLGSIDDARAVQVITFPPSAFGSQTIGGSSTTTTIELASGSDTTDMGAGDWVRINDEIRQVESISNDARSFVLAVPLSSAPAAGDVAYACRPAGSEIRLRVRLTTDDSDESPKLLALALYCEANVTDRWLITLNVRIEDQMLCLDNSPYPMDAAALAGELENWITRKTAFTLHDVRGTERTVKVANAVELQPKRSSDTPSHYFTTMTLGLVEVDVEAV